MTTLADRVQRARLAIGVSQRGLAKMSGVPQATLSNIESGYISRSKHIPALETVLKTKLTKQFNQEK